MPLSTIVLGSPVYTTANISPIPPGLSSSNPGTRFLYVLFAANKPDTALASAAGNFVELGTFAGGAGSTGIDTGPTNIMAAWSLEDVAMAQSATLAALSPDNNVSWGLIVGIFLTEYDDVDVAITGGVDATGGTGYSVTTSSVPAAFIQDGDVVLLASAFPTDTNPTWGTPTLTAAGGGTIALGAVQGTAQNPSTTTGQDLGGRVVAYKPTVSAPLSAGPLTFSATLSGTTTNAHGPLAVVRLRPVAPAAPPSFAAFGIPL